MGIIEQTVALLPQSAKMFRHGSIVILSGDLSHMRCG